MGDNDALAMNVAQLVEAQAVVLLSDVPGLYDRAPGEADAALIPHVEELTDSVTAAAGGSGSAVGSGGMATKLSAAVAARHGGIPLVVADGRRRGVLGDIFRGREVGTFFSPARARRKSARQQWIAFSRPAAGRIEVDAGAVRALVETKRSLLAIGVRGVEGDFDEADTVSIVGPGGGEIARGLANVSAGELRRIAGRRSDAFSDILGYDCPETVVHRDNLTMLET
jgi:glutamate 5-kinase